MFAIQKLFNWYSDRPIKTNHEHSMFLMLPLSKH
jgi:hypothetical protein